MAQIWALIGELKTHTYVTHQNEVVKLVPSSPSSYLFREFCDATKSGLSNPLFTCSPLSSLGCTNTDSTSLAIQGERVSVLEKLCIAIAQETSSCPKAFQVVSFFGNQQSKSYLKNRMASLGLLVEDLTEDTSQKDSDWSSLLTHLRKNKELSIEDRLELSKHLINHPPYSSETLDLYFSRLQELKILSNTQHALLNTFATKLNEVEPLPSERKIILAPWAPLPATHQAHIWAFADDSLFEPEDLDLLLSETELESLFFAGFHLPRWTETLRARQDTLRQLSLLHPGKVYTSIPSSQLDTLQISHESLPHSSSSPVNNKLESYTASLPIRTLSATQLETYAECPSKYLYRRMKLKERVEPLSDFPLQFGQAVHLTLEHLLADNTSSNLDESLLKEAFQTSLKTVLPHNKTTESLAVVYLKAFDKLIPRILETEITITRLFQPTSHLAAEQEFKIDLEGFSFTGKIDRIDLLPDNQILILDYKTGSVDFTPDHLAKGSNFQALLYWFGAEKATGHSPSAMLFYDLKKGEIRRGLAREECISSEAKKELTRGHSLKPDKLEALITAGLQSLHRVSKEIHQGNFAPTPSVEACRFCEASDFCRAGVENV